MHASFLGPSVCKNDGRQEIGAYQLKWDGLMKRWRAGRVEWSQGRDEFLEKIMGVMSLLVVGLKSEGCLVVWRKEEEKWRNKRSQLRGIKIRRKWAGRRDWLIKKEMGFCTELQKMGLFSLNVHGGLKMEFLSNLDIKMICTVSEKFPQMILSI